MGWSNDQLNALYIYSASNGMLILSVDESGLYLANTADGSYVRIESRASRVNPAYDVIAMEMQPPNSSVVGVVYGEGEVVADEFIWTPPTQVSPEIVIFSPYIAPGGYAAALYLQGQSNLSAVDNSAITLAAADTYGYTGNVISAGLTDTAIGTFSNSTGATEVIVDYVGPRLGIVQAVRTYEAMFSGSCSSTSGGDRIGLRLYLSASNSSLAGATLLVDFGSVTVAAAGVTQPFGSLMWMLSGDPTKYVVLAIRRTSGAGTITVTTTYRAYRDVFRT